MDSEYIILNNIETHLLTLGNPSNCKGKDVIVCVTGNPGIPDFYIEFCVELHRQTELPVCIIGQAGHVHVHDKMSNCLKNQHHFFDLEGQLTHKLDLINNYIDKTSKLHLIGHSIGAWEIVELADQNHNVLNRLSSVNLLFPTLQKMAETKNGKLLNLFFRRIHYLLLVLTYIVSLLPERIKLELINLYLKWNSLPLEYNSRIEKLLNLDVLEKVLFMAYHEMDCVKKLNVLGLDKIKHISNVVYSSRDDWAPVSYIDELKVFQPHLNFVEVNISHAFVLKSSMRVADIVVKFIKQNLSN